jgi:hypothetical protein
LTGPLIVVAKIAAQWTTRWFATASCLAVLTLPTAADPDCRSAGNIAPGLQKLIHEFQDAERTGAAALSVEDFLVGVTDIAAQDRADLDRRGAVKVAKTGPSEGSVANDGQKQLQFEGLFAGRQTFFRVPQHIQSRFHTAPDKLTLYYEPSHALQLGEALPLIGIPVFLTVNHVVITPNRLFFFWGSNSSDQPDRCYIPS